MLAWGIFLLVSSLLTLGGLWLVMKRKTPD